MAKVVFTRHALTKLQERGIQKEKVLATLRNPQKLTTEADKFYASRKFGKRYLKVIFVRADENVIVITQHYLDKLL